MDSVTLTVDAVVYSITGWEKSNVWVLMYSMFLRVLDPLRAAVALIDYNQLKLVS
jgi:hypothetical protein